MNHKYNIQFLILTASWLLSSTSMAAPQGFIWGYNLGVSYEVTTRYAQISYDSPRQGPFPENCEQTVDNNPQQMHCTAFLAPDTSDSKSISIFLEAPFVREGLFYFEPGLTFSTISYQGVLNSKPQGPQAGGSSNNSPNGKNFSTTQPLNQAKINFYGINLQGYLRVGMTPLYLPDLFITTGLGMQVANGKIKVFTESQTRTVVQPDVFAEVEMVPIRFGEGGFLSLYLGQDQSLASFLSTNLIDDNPSGTPLTNFKLSLIGSAAGLRFMILF